MDISNSQNNVPLPSAGNKNQKPASNKKNYVVAILLNLLLIVLSNFLLVVAYYMIGGLAGLALVIITIPLYALFLGLVPLIIIVTQIGNPNFYKPFLKIYVVVFILSAIFLLNLLTSTYR